MENRYKARETVHRQLFSGQKSEVCMENRYKSRDIVHRMVRNPSSVLKIGTQVQILSTAWSEIELFQKVFVQVEILTTISLARKLRCENLLYEVAIWYEFDVKTTGSSFATVMMRRQRAAPFRGFDIKAIASSHATGFTRG